MFGNVLAIENLDIPTRQMDVVQGIAAQTLRAAKVETAEDPRTPLDILDGLVEIIDPEITGLAKERMISVAAGFGDPGMPAAQIRV